MARGGTHVEFLDLLLELVDAVLELTNSVVLRADHVVELITEVILHVVEFLMLSDEVLLKAVVVFFCSLETVVQGGDLGAKDVIVLCKQVTCGHEVRLEVGAPGRLCLGQGDVMMNDGLHVVVYPR